MISRTHHHHHHSHWHLSVVAVFLREA